MTQPPSEGATGTTTASSKAAFDAALEHAVGVLEKTQQRMRKNSETSTGGPDNSAEKPVGQHNKSVKESSGDTATFVFDVSAFRTAITEKAVIAAQRAEEAAGAREEVETQLLAVSTAAQEVARLAEQALKSIAEIKQMPDDVQDPNIGDDPESMNGQASGAHSSEVARSCGELVRQLAERSRSRCGLTLVSA